MRRTILMLGAIVGFLGLAAVPLTKAEDVFTPTQKEALHQIIRDYLVENPEVLVEAMNVLQERQQQAQIENQRKLIANNKTILFNAAEDAFIGNPNARTTIVEFFDYRCGYCKSMVAQLRELAEQDKDLKIVLKEFPILGPDSIVGAKASLAARTAPRFADFHLALMTAPGKLTDDVVDRIARAVGLDVAKLRKDMEQPGIESILGRNKSIAQGLGITGTPAFIIGDTVYPGAMEIDQVKKLIAAARAAG